MKPLLSLLCLLLWPLSALAQNFDDVISAELRPGWRLPDGTHMAALHMQLAPGWKTYWRAPGDAGIPPEFSWMGARNVAGVEVIWPAPGMFYQSGMRSIGYEGTVVLPLRITLQDAARKARLGGVVDIGICKDICIPHRIRVKADLPGMGDTRPDPKIAAALADRPLTGREAGMGPVTCSVALESAGVQLTAQIPADGPWGTVVEAGNPEIWVAEPDISLSGGVLTARTHLQHSRGAGFALDRSALRFTFFRPRDVVEIQGCTG